MSKTILQQALDLAQALDVAVFPVSRDKRPIVKGWRTKASRDPDEIKALFSMGGACGIGVPCGPDNDLICFDLDFGHTDDPARKAALQAWVDQHTDEINDGAIVRQTRSGGLHVIMPWPEGKRPPRRIMPKLDVIIDGFYFVWAMDDGGYRLLGGEIGDRAPSDAMLEVVERDTLGTGSALMSADEAHEAMWSDGDTGQRHDALLRMTHDWASENPGASIEELCAGFEHWFTDIYGDRIEADRIRKLLEWDVEDERGELYRAFRGVRATPDAAGARLAKAAEKLKAKGRLLGTPAPVHEVVRKPPPKPTMDDILRIDGDELLDKELESIDWIVEGSIPAGNLISWAGPSGAGKTRYISLLMACLMTGRTDIMGLPKATRPVSMLYIANEERAADIERRVKAAMVANGLTGGRPAYVRGKDSGRFTMTSRVGKDLVRNDDLLDALVEQVKQLEVEMVVFDPFVTLGSGGESEPGDIDLVNSFLMDLASRTGAAVAHVHHTPKDRSAAPDEQRGLDGAWRGHGSIYSALDMGETIFPYLPPGASDKKKRRQLSDMEKAGMVDRYVVVDSVKVREGHAAPARLYRLTEAPVNKEGQQIGVLKHVADMRAVEGELEARMNGPEIEAVARKKLAWATALFDMAGGETKKTSLVDIHTHMQKHKVEHWTDAHRIEARKGFGAAFLSLMQAPTKVLNCLVAVTPKGREGIVINIIRNAE